MSKFTCIPLNYSNHLLNNYESLNNLPGFVLLESSDKQRGRYDIITALPYDSLYVLRNSANIQGAFQQLQSMLPIVPSTCDLPFQGGAIGYIAYDIAEIMAGIKSTPHSANDMPLIDMRFYDWAIVVDHRLRCVNLVAANTRPDTAAIIDEVQQRWRRDCATPSSFVLQQSFMPLISQEEYQQAFHAIHQELSRGRAYQINYTQPFLAHYRGDPWEMYTRVRAKNPVPYSAFLRCADGDVLSFSPERFLTMEDGRVLTSPIKGTIKRSADPTLDEKLRLSLLTSTKDRAENVMIVDLLRNDLGKLAVPGSVEVTSLCEVQSYNAVHHLVSDIRAICLPDIAPIQVFKACFPGGSITGAPKRESMRIINEQEQFSRGVYCGSIGYFSAHGRFDCSIAIRTLVAKEDTLYLSAGGGIVIDSNWEDEYRECFAKIAAIVNHIRA